LLSISGLLTSQFKPNHLVVFFQALGRGFNLSRTMSKSAISVRQRDLIQAKTGKPWLWSASFVLNFDRKALKIPLNSLQAMVLNFAEVLTVGMPARCASLFKKNFEEREKTECELRWQGELTKSLPIFLQR
jgi:hypothetical protein